MKIIWNYGNVSSLMCDNIESLLYTSVYNNELTVLTEKKMPYFSGTNSISNGSRVFGKHN